MKIAFLTPEYPHPKTGTSGGIGTSIMNLAKGLADKGNAVFILVYGQKQDFIFEENGIVFYGIKNVKLKGLSWYLTRKKIQRLIDQLYKSNKIEVVEAPDWTGITSFINSKCPIVIRQNGSDTYFCHLDKRKVKFINRFHEKRALERADAIISVSHFTGTLTKQLFGLKSDFTVIPNCIDTEFFKNPDAIASNESSTILYFGSLIRKKGLLELPLIFNSVIEHKPDARLILAGKDVPDIISGNASTWEMMQALFSEKAFANVDYLGAVDYKLIREYIVDAGICVFPSFAEALPVSWLEAMALKKAVVTSDIGWAPEIINDGTDGFLVNPTDHNTYAERIVALLNDTDLRKRMGEKAREKIVAEFSIAAITETNMKFYTSVITS